jgi:hypothetical protein
MKWKLPEVGDTKTKVIFAFIPRTIGNLDGGTKIWLQRVKVHYVYEGRWFESPEWHEDSYEELLEEKDDINPN